MTALRAIALCCALVVPALAQDARPPGKYNTVRSYIRKAVRRGEAPSMAVGVIEKGEVVWAEAFGYQDLDAKIAATSSTLYRLGSVSTTLTGAGLMLLVERGALDLDKPANTYLEKPRLRAHRGDVARMTVRRLADHTAGLAGYWNLYLDDAPPPGLTQTIDAYGFAAHPPGTREMSSPLGYVVLERLIGRAAGTPWQQFMIASVYEPLGMHQTGVGPRNPADRLAVAYQRVERKKFTPLPPYRTDHDAAAAVCTTIGDMNAFLRACLGQDVDGRRLLKPESLRAMYTPASDVTKNAIGWATDRFWGRPSVYQSSSMPGGGALVRVYPESDAAIVVLTNAGVGALLNEVARRIVRPLLGPSKTEPPIRAQPASTELSEAPTLESGVWRGRLLHYGGDIPVAIEIQRERFRAKIAFAGGAMTPMAQVNYFGATLMASTTHPIPTHSGQAQKPGLRFTLSFEDGRLLGTCQVIQAPYCNLPHWVELSLDKSR